jgi:hypothetical protein
LTGKIKKLLQYFSFSGPADCSPARSAVALSTAAVPPSKNAADNLLRSAAYGAFYAYFAVQRLWATAQSMAIPSRFSDYFAYYRLQEIEGISFINMNLYHYFVFRFT